MSSPTTNDITSAAASSIASAAAPVVISVKTSASKQQPQPAVSRIDEKETQVIKRNGDTQVLDLKKIHTRLKALGKKACVRVDFAQLTVEIVKMLPLNVQTSEIDLIGAQVIYNLSSRNPDYEVLSSFILIDNHHKITPATMLESVQRLCANVDSNGVPFAVLHPDFVTLVTENADTIEAMIDYERDFLLRFFGFKTLEGSYLLKSNGKIAERPQHLWMRVALALHGTNWDLVKETYDCLSNKYFIHATPTLFNAGTICPQLSSCFLLAMHDDSIDGIFKTAADCARISKYSGGIGLHLHSIRSKGAKIRGTNGVSNGIVPMLRVFNEIANYVNQGGKRLGSISCYIEPWHRDIYFFLELRKNHGDQKMRAPDLFTALWIPDLFMKRVFANEHWTLMCPDQCPGLSDVYGDEFEELYTRYESEGRGERIQAQDLWMQIIASQMETSTPYLLYKDAVNRKSNQKNIGVIKSSNLCAEIVEFSSPEETAVCNLGSIALQSCITYNKKLQPVFDFEKLHSITQILIRNLNRVIDITFYPTEECRTSNLRHRPIGLGTQGLADVFFAMGYGFCDLQAKILNRQIFATMYHAAVTQSCEIAKRDGPYSTFKGSPISQGIFQFDMWGVQPPEDLPWDWESLRRDVMMYGVRNSLLLATMPTASSSQLLASVEGNDPLTSNLFKRNTLAGEFKLFNHYLVRDLIHLGLWNDNIRTSIEKDNGSVQNIAIIPNHLKEKYKTVWEMKMSDIIDMSADRGAFICQSQSLNLFIAQPTVSKLSSMHKYAFEKGLKTGIYYLRRLNGQRTAAFHIVPDKAEINPHAVEVEDEEENVCTMCSA